MGYLSYQHRDLSRRQRGAIIARGIASDIGYKVQEYPKTAVVAFALAVYGTVSGVSAVHEHSVLSEALPQLKNQKSHLAETSTLGVHRSGTIFYGVAQLKDDGKNPDTTLLNSALAANVRPDDKSVGCRVAELSVRDTSGILRTFFKQSVVATTFNNEAFTVEKYTCAGKTLTPTVPRPLAPFIKPSSAQAPNVGMV